ncbi:MAG: ribonuclease P protein component [Proteobacteria bacterium]|nr:ribonuclease P protein component [Pseudomonadota bacterium]
MTAAHACAGGRFPRTARLLRPAQFENVFAGGQRLNGTMFRLHVRDAANAAMVADAADRRAPVPRLGIAVPKRVAASAVERNRIRRIVREDFRHRRGQLAAVDYVLVAQRAAAAAPAPALRDALAGLWRRAATLKPADATPTMRDSRHRPALAGQARSPTIAREDARTDSRPATARDRPPNPQDD